jgi:imidazolonepropionase-like amidohydrolase
MNKLLIFLLINFLLILDVQTQNLIIKDVNLVSVENKNIEKTSIVIQNGIIVTIADYSSIKKMVKDLPTKIINAKGKYCIPGLADMHVHLPNRSKMDSFINFNLAAGITQIRVMNYADDFVEAKDQVSKIQIAPNMHFGYIIKRETKLNDLNIDSLILDYKNRGFSFIKLFSLSDENTFDMLMKAANKNGIIVCGHYPKYSQFGKFKMIDFQKVAESGFRSIEHLAGYNMNIEESLKEQIIFTKRNNVFNCPTIDWDVIAYKTLSIDEYKLRMAYQLLPKRITENWKIESHFDNLDSIKKLTIIENRKKIDQKIELLKKLDQHECPLILGSDGGGVFQPDGFNMYEEMMHWEKAGISPRSILKACTINAAKFFNEEDKWGSIQIGKEGSLVLLTKNPLLKIENMSTIFSTIHKGKIYIKKELIK